MQEVSVNAQAKEAKVGAGPTASDVCAAVSRYGLIAVTGNTGAVSLVGLLLGGGYGPIQPKYGLAADNLLEAELVLANGQIVRANTSQHPDLFWAIRGGGGNFGIVTSVRIRLHELSSVLSGVIVYPWRDAVPVLKAYGEVMSSAPDELAVAAVLSTGPEGDPVVVLAPTWSGELEAGRQEVSRLQALGTPLTSQAGPEMYGEMLRNLDAQIVNFRHYFAETRRLETLGDEPIHTLVESYAKRTSPFSMVMLSHFHGMGTRIASDASAFSMRRDHFVVLIYATWESASKNESIRHRQWATHLSASLAPFSLPGGYANVLAPEAHEQISEAYGTNATKLISLTQKLDPSNVFSSAIRLPSKPDSSINVQRLENRSSILT
jgi:hypothetical protein